MQNGLCRCSEILCIAGKGTALILFPTPWREGPRVFCSRCLEMTSHVSEAQRRRRSDLKNKARRIVVQPPEFQWCPGSLLSEEEQWAMCDVLAWPVTSHILDGGIRAGPLFWVPRGLLLQSALQTWPCSRGSPGEELTFTWAPWCLTLHSPLLPQLKRPARKFVIKILPMTKEIVWN